MIRRTLTTVVVLGAAWVLVNMLPDVARYIKIRQM